MAPAEPNDQAFKQQGEVPYFAEERKGWKGYIEWEKYPEKKKQAIEILKRYDFPVVSRGVLYLVWNLRLVTILSPQSSN